MEEPLLHTIVQHVSEVNFPKGTELRIERIGSHFEIRIETVGTKRDLHTAVNMLGLELDMIERKVKQSVLDEYRSTGERIGF